MFNFNYEKPKVVAEIGCNHLGDFKIAKELILLAKECGADYAKFQKRNPKELLNEDQYNSPHPEPWQSYGETYGKHREFLEFTIEQHQALKSFCDASGIGYAVSVWDITSAKEIITINPDYLKIPSACNTDIELLQLISDQFNGDIHVSAGMTTPAELETLISLFEKTNAARSKLVIYACTSGYPIGFNDVCLLEIKKLYEQYGDRVKEIGFSGHHLGIAIDVAAYTLGAKWIERHFTKDRTWKGTDDAASLEVPGMQKLVRDLQHTFESLTYKNKEIMDIETPQRIKLKNKK